MLQQCHKEDNEHGRDIPALHSGLKQDHVRKGSAALYSPDLVGLEKTVTAGTSWNRMGNRVKSVSELLSLVTSRTPAPMLSVSRSYSIIAKWLPYAALQCPARP